MKHTKGPWNLSFRSHQDGSGGSKTWEVYKDHIIAKGTNWTIENEANARLIAVAPNLLAACEELVSEFEQRNMDFMADHPGSLGLEKTAGIIMAEEAIAKVKGGA